MRDLLERLARLLLLRLERDVGLREHPDESAVLDDTRSRRTWYRAIILSASPRSCSGSTVTSSRDATSPTLTACGSTRSATARTTMSRSVRMPRR